MLLFKKKFLEAIRTGEKTQTVRLWKYRPHASRTTQLYSRHGYIRVHSVDEVELSDLTDEDARLDGFDSADALRAEIAALYPRQLAGGLSGVSRAVCDCAGGGEEEELGARS